jgi:probable F420-dependent oxidoreductase
MIPMSGYLHLDLSLMGLENLKSLPDLSQTIEALGFDGIWSSEVNHDPFIPLAMAAERTRRMTLGTSIALSFTRSPMTLAYTCWDLAFLSSGRFNLGLGTQIKAHNERRFGVLWDTPLPRLREVIDGLRAIWKSWRTGDRLNFRGDHYQFTLMTPFFTPPPHAYDIPIGIAGVNTGLCRLAGELCDGFHIHPLHSIKYVTDIIRPAIAEGAARRTRPLEDFSLIASLFVITGENAEEMLSTREMVRQQISFYASTPSYRIILETHGWGEVADRLSRLAARKQWGEMPSLINDEMLDTFAIVAPPDEVGASALQRYKGLVDRVVFYLPYQPGQRNVMWTSTLKAFANQR